ncbi:DUF4199 domain-containing protein [Mucilaginibacter ginsenosidivorax]|uniref:DUF4199 domain-containing protein n=1 Tax=Mucilaginibacter ginsenosidivorax TaxID=862126 RepID=A0A5B8W6X5_9SPHI|nr:DUF4199 domain-containing protein [Mucilaginibacter ginsenosidivorax]QEC78666.1 DUF4199 domain-containing protein [Mucilaginibacter ginsenosidivorax]
MRKNILVYGFIGGLIPAAWAVVVEAMLSNSLSLNTRMVLGYTSMIIAFSLIFVAVKNYRDNYNNGIITFGNTLKIGLLITLIASTIYVIVWMVDYSYFIPDFGEKYQAQVLAELKASGASAAVIKKQGAEMAVMMEKYKSSPAFRVMFTYLEIVPVGIVVSLIAALILKNKSKPATVVSTMN